MGFLYSSRCWLLLFVLVFCFNFPSYVESLSTLAKWSDGVKLPTTTSKFDIRQTFFPRRRSKDRVQRIAENSKENAALDEKLLRLSFFSFLHQVSMPFADLVDSAYLSHMDSTSLGAMGVAMSSQNAMSKLYNSPLSKTTLSLVASFSGDEEKKQQCEEESTELSAAVSAAIVLASFVGLIQLLLFTVGANGILGIYGVSSTNAMHSAALAYTRARALGAPCFTLWLVVNNIFRGLGDARSPLIGAIVFNVINIVMDHVFLRTFNLGVVGSAFASSLTQAIAILPLLWMLHKRVTINLRIDLGEFVKFLKKYAEATIYLLGRSIARTAAYSYTSRRAALLGPVAASSYSIMFQIGLWITMACEGIAIANQSLLSRILSSADATTKGTPDDTKKEVVRHLVKRSCQVGVLSSVIMSMLVYAFWNNIISTFTTSPAIQAAAATTLPFFLLAQIVKGFSLPMNGIIMGGMDWSAAMWSMCASNVACFLVLKLKEESAKMLWMAWVASYAAQGLVLFIRYKSRTRLWSLSSESKQV